MGIFIFVAIVAVLAWFIYSGMRRQSAQFGAVAPVTRVLDAPLRQSQTQTASSESLESVPLFVNVQQSFQGEPNKIVQTLNDLADILQHEMDKRIFPNEQATNAKRVDHEIYRSLVSQQSNRLMLMFHDAEIGFERASTPTGGTPEMLRRAYAVFLDQLIAAARAFRSAEAPPTYAQTQAMFREFLEAFYRQIAEWPKTLRDASKNVTADSCIIVLSANHDVGPMQHAIQTESA